MPSAPRLPSLADGAHRAWSSRLDQPGGSFRPHPGAAPRSVEDTWDDFSADDDEFVPFPSNLPTNPDAGSTSSAQHGSGAAGAAAAAGQGPSSSSRDEDDADADEPLLFPPRLLGGRAGGSRGGMGLGGLGEAAGRLWTLTDQPGIDFLVAGPAVVAWLPHVYVILFGVGERETEGIYSLRAFGLDGVPQETIITFESEEDAQR